MIHVEQVCIVLLPIVRLLLILFLAFVSSFRPRQNSLPRELLLYVLPLLVVYKLVTNLSRRALSFDLTTCTVRRFDKFPSFLFLSFYPTPMSDIDQLERDALAPYPDLCETFPTFISFDPPTDSWKIFWDLNDRRSSETAIPSSTVHSFTHTTGMVDSDSIAPVKVSDDRHYWTEPSMEIYIGDLDFEKRVTLEWIIQSTIEDDGADWVLDILQKAYEQFLMTDLSLNQVKRRANILDTRQVELILDWKTQTFIFFWTISESQSQDPIVKAAGVFPDSQVHGKPITKSYRLLPKGKRILFGEMNMVQRMKFKGIMMQETSQRGIYWILQVLTFPEINKLIRPDVMLQISGYIDIVRQQGGLEMVLVPPVRTYRCGILT